jgi:hypothetical protein
MEPKKKIKKVDGFDIKPKVSFRPTPIEPRRRYRYLLQIPLGEELIEFFVNCERPLQRVDTFESSWGFGDINRGRQMGRLRWDPMRVIFRDVVGVTTHSDAINALQSWIRSMSERQATRTYKKSITIQMLDPTGIVVESWNLVGAYPSSIQIDTDYNQYDHNILHDIEMDIVFDHCVINT